MKKILRTDRYAMPAGTLNDPRASQPTEQPSPTVAHSERRREKDRKRNGSVQSFGGNQSGLTTDRDSFGLEVAQR